MQREFIKSPIDIVIDSAFGIPTTAWLTYGDKRLLTAKASREFAGQAFFGNFEASYIQSKLQPDWREEREKELNSLSR